MKERYEKGIKEKNEEMRRGDAPCPNAKKDTTAKLPLA